MCEDMCKDMHIGMCKGMCLRHANSIDLIGHIDVSVFFKRREIASEEHSWWVLRASRKLLIATLFMLLVYTASWHSSPSTFVQT